MGASSNIWALGIKEGIGWVTSGKSTVAELSPKKSIGPSSSSSESFSGSLAEAFDSASSGCGRFRTCLGVKELGRRTEFNLAFTTFFLGWGRILSKSELEEAVFPTWVVVGFTDWNLNVWIHDNVYSTYPVLLLFFFIKSVVDYRSFQQRTKLSKRVNSLLRHRLCWIHFRFCFLGKILLPLLPRFQEIFQFTFLLNILLKLFRDSWKPAKRLRTVSIF